MGERHPLAHVKGFCGLNFIALICNSAAAIFFAVIMDKVNNFSQVIAAGGVVFSRDEKILMIFRRRVWDLPKGHLDAGETLRECAVREVCEECGLNAARLETHEIVARTTHQSAPNEEKHTTWFRMTYTGDPARIKPQTEEGITRIAWFTPAEALENAAASYPNIREILAAISSSAG